MSTDKTMSLRQAISTFVADGQTIAIEGFGHLSPNAAAHEIVRQGFTDLTLAKMTGDLLIDQLLAAGSVSKLVTSFMGNSSAGSLHEVRRRVEKHDPAPLDIEEYSHGGMVGRYVAGASKLPFYPVASYRGSDIADINPRIQAVADPFTGDSICVVPPLNPDVSLIHAQRADAKGNVQAWGILGVQQEVAFAADRVIVTVEEIVDDEVVRSDPNRTIIPSSIVDAVVECPRGAYPSSVQGYYDRDDDFLREWSEMSRDPAQTRRWIDRYILGTADHREFIAALGEERFDRLGVRERWSIPVNYGSRR